MATDPIILGMVKIREHILSNSEDMTRISFDGMYQVGRAQGTVDGLREALSILESVLRDEDNDQPTPTSGRGEVKVSRFGSGSQSRRENR